MAGCASIAPDSAQAAAYATSVRVERGADSENSLVRSFGVAPDASTVGVALALNARGVALVDDLFCLESADGARHVVTLSAPTTDDSALHQAQFVLLDKAGAELAILDLEASAPSASVPLPAHEPVEVRAILRGDEGAPGDLHFFTIHLDVDP